MRGLLHTVILALHLRDARLLTTVGQNQHCCGRIDSLLTIPEMTPKPTLVFAMDPRAERAGHVVELGVKIQSLVKL
ncbi:MAG TPA: hypothetical protein VNQ76_20080 [Planctomicrobium sp.]|nr:hypothetical protein [Planctomicrobium sp.]